MYGGVPVEKRGGGGTEVGGSKVFQMRSFNADARYFKGFSVREAGVGTWILQRIICIKNR